MKLRGRNAFGSWMVWDEHGAGAIRLTPNTTPQRLAEIMKDNQIDASDYEAFEVWTGVQHIMTLHSLSSGWGCKLEVEPRTSVTGLSFPDAVIKALALVVRDEDFDVDDDDAAIPDE